MRLIDADKLMADIASAERSTSKDYILLTIARYIRIQPTIDAEPVRHGKWEHGKEVSREYIGGKCVAIGYKDYHCSVCGQRYKTEPTYNYCPNCGAKMIPTIPKEIIDAVLGEDEVEE